MKVSDLFPQAAALVAGGLHQLALQREDELARIARFTTGQTDLIPLAMLARNVALMAKDAEPIGARKELAYYESARAFIRAAKEGIRTRALTARDQGTGVPLGLAAWCAEDETLKTLEEMMPHARVMVRAGEAVAWMESIGATVPPLLRLGAPDRLQGHPGGHQQRTTAAPTTTTDQPSRAPENARQEPKRMNAAKKAIRAILHAHGHSTSKRVAVYVVFRAVDEGRVPAPYQLRWSPDENGGKVMFWTDTKGEEHPLSEDTVRRYAMDAWTEIYGGRFESQSGSD